ncbi:hypothetical protein LCGC14_2954900 [marine sediment metagenome]|uniref:Uncharacterized protein n=1 Tax=marine sediment metagenome TaxID=412755 RepID=A0A0F9A5D2_9ZZZZ
MDEYDHIRLKAVKRQIKITILHQQDMLKTIDKLLEKKVEE